MRARNDGSSVRALASTFRGPNKRASLLGKTTWPASSIASMASSMLGRITQHVAARGGPAAAPVASGFPPMSDVKITKMTVRDIRFHTSKDSSGSDARSPDPDYSCAYVTVKTDSDLEGYGLSFTIGRGTHLGMVWQGNHYH